MSGISGADVAQLRTLAQRFDQLAGRLDADRMTVGNAIQVSAWAGPVAVRFRHQWDSEHSRRVHDAALRLRDAAQKLRTNADDQERTSSVDGGGLGGLPGGFPLLPGGFMRGLGAAPGAFLTAVAGSTLFGKINSAIGNVGLAADIGDVVNLARHASSQGQLGAIVKYTKDIKTLDVLKQGGVLPKQIAAGKILTVVSGSKVATVLGHVGKVAGIAGVVLGTVDTAAKAVNGDTEGAIYSGVKTAISAAAMIPGPQQPFIAAAAIGIGVGELVYEHREAITEAARSTVKVIANSPAAKAVGHVADAAGSAMRGLAATAKKYWPF